jgi:metal-responsive CopG/Arc/MetJ family transcriptional regulator
MSTVEVELDDELIRRIDEQVAATGRPRSEVIADALQRQFGGGRLREILASARERSGLSEDEAMELAISELDAYRSDQHAS